MALGQCLASVRKGGRINLIGFYDDARVVLPPITQIVMNEITVTGSRANPNVSERALDMFEAGLIAGDKVVTHAFPLEKIRRGARDLREPQGRRHQGGCRAMRTAVERPSRRAR